MMMIALHGWLFNFTELYVMCARSGDSSSVTLTKTIWKKRDFTFFLFFLPQVDRVIFCLHHQKDIEIYLRYMQIYFPVVADREVRITIT